jgi:carbamate kinase
MRVVVALGGNALLRRGEPLEAVAQLTNLARVVPALAALAQQHELVVTHGNGPQVGLLSLESAADPTLAAPYPLDALGAETQGMIGYWLARELGGALPDRRVVALLTQTVVDPADPAFADPAKFVGPEYPEGAVRAMSASRGWQFRRDGSAWRRVVPSPEPQEIVELPAIRLLVQAGVLVIAAGGGGVPVARTAGGRLTGVEAVVDKDLTAAVLATALRADALLLLTDVAAVYRRYGQPDARPIGRTTVDELRAERFPAGSMAPKVAAACRFVEATGSVAAIGALADAPLLLGGQAGTLVTPAVVAAPA